MREIWFKIMSKLPYEFGVRRQERRVVEPGLVGEQARRERQVARLVVDPRLGVRAGALIKRVGGHGREHWSRFPPQKTQKKLN